MWGLSSTGPNAASKVCKGLRIMPINRRGFFKVLGTAGAAVATGGASVRASSNDPDHDAADYAVGVLVDIPNCIGCRKCEFACRKAAGFDVPPIETFDDKSVFDETRRPAPDSYTVVNRYPNPNDETKPVYTKINCLHCVDPACASACLVGALSKNEKGPVTYDPWKCMGCRYCMVACPFQIPTYDYDTPLTPQVRKCTLCFDRLEHGEDVPACVKICPQDCLTFGKRSDLLQIAHDKIAARPDVYVDHVYGEHEVGGTSWLYLSSVPFEKLGFLTLSDEAPPRLTETIQHGIFKGFVAPVALYGLLGMIMWLSRRPQEAAVVAANDGGADQARREEPSPVRGNRKKPVRPVVSAGKEVAHDRV